MFVPERTHRAVALPLAWLIASSGWAQTTTKPEHLRRTLDYFPLVVWNQPQRNLARLRRLGINTVVNGEKMASTAARRAFLDACRKARVRGVLQVRGYADELDAHPALAMWLLPDEPDLNPKRTLGGFEPRIKPAEVARWIAKLPGSRSKPLWLNTTVRFFAPYRQLGLDWYGKYYALADVCGFDHYPVTGWNAPNRVPELEPASRRAVSLAGPRPVLAIVEASDQDLAWTAKETRGPSAAELRQEVFLSLIGGARAVGYFTIAFHPFRWMHLTMDVEAELCRTNRELALLGGFLARPEDARLVVESDVASVRCAARPGPNGAFVLVVANRTSERVQARLSVRRKLGLPKQLTRIGNDATYALDHGVVALDLGAAECCFLRSDDGSSRREAK